MPGIHADLVASGVVPARSIAEAVAAQPERKPADKDKHEPKRRGGQSSADFEQLHPRARGGTFALKNSSPPTNTVLVGSDGQPLKNAWMVKVVTRLSTRVPLAPGQVEIRFGQAPGARPGSTAATTKPAPGAPSVVYFDPAAIRAANNDPAFDLAHELGHEYDFRAMPEWARARYRQIMRTDQRRPWRSGDSGWNPAQNHVEEEFADAYAAVALGKMPPSEPDTLNTGNPGVYHFNPSRKQFRALTRMFQTLARQAVRA